jgi:crystallin alpha B
MDTSQYRPDELKVNVMENNLTVEAKHTEESEDGSKYIASQFVRKYTLPTDCKHERVSSNLSSDGVLIISAPKSVPQITALDSGRNVPISRDYVLTG